MNRKTHFTAADNIFWRKTGNGKPILVLHGWGSQSEVMMPVASELGDIRTFYIPDLPGFGRSPAPVQSWSVDDYADAVVRFVTEVMPVESFDLLVHSFGARIAIKLLVREDFSSRIDKVIFTGAAGLKPERKPGFYLKKYSAGILKTPFMILPAGYREKGLAKLRATSLWKKLGSADYQKLSGVMRETFVKTVTEYLDPLLPGITHEVLLIWGESDEATPATQGKRMEAGLQRGTLILMKDAGHYAFLDQTRLFNSIARAYLDPGPDAGSE